MQISYVLYSAYVANMKNYDEASYLSVTLPKPQSWILDCPSSCKRWFPHYFMPENLLGRPAGRPLCREV